MNSQRNRTLKIEVNPALRDNQRIATKKFRGDNSILHASIYPMVHAFRIFGFAPYEFDNDDQLVPSVKYIIFSILGIIIHSYCMYFKSLDALDHDWAGQDVLSTLIVLSEVLNYLVVVYDLTMNLLMRRRFVRVWNAFQDFDEIMKEIHQEREEKKTRIWVWLVIIFNFIIWTVISGFGIIAWEETWFSNTTYLIMYVASAANVTKFSGLVMMLSQRFNDLNRIVRENISIKPKSACDSEESFDPALIERLHDDLITVGKNLESIYNPDKLFWIGNLTLHTAVRIYYICILFEILPICCLVAWSICTIWQLWLINFACHSASNEARFMTYTMLEWKRWLYRQGKCMDILPELLTDLHRKLNFTAAGSFDVHLPLITSITAFITTTLVILLQFS